MGQVRRPAAVKSHLECPGPGVRSDEKQMQITTILFAAALLGAGEPDTLDVATVTAEKGFIVSRKDTLEIAGHENATFFLMQSPGLTVSDMGGPAGLKTVSLKGLGSAHTSVCIDGIRIGNMQSGQTDLSALGIQDYRDMVIDYAQNSINFRTAKPEFSDERERFCGKASVAGGSFGTWMPSLRLGWKVSDKVTMAANAGGLISKGDFPYAGADADGGETTLIRTGNDMRQIRGSIDAFGSTEGGEWTAKAYFATSDRGTPGSVSWPSEDRQKDMNTFIQGSISQRISNLYSMKANAKLSYDDLKYISSWGNSRYGQYEAMLNSSHIWNLNDFWRISGAAGLRWDGLDSGNYDSGIAEGKGLINRYGLDAVIGTDFGTEKFKATVSIEYALSLDSGIKGGSTVRQNSLSPSASIRYNFLKGLSVNAFGRRAFRAPMFNELYYIGYGNTSLKAEDAWLAGAGIEWHRTISGAWRFDAKADGFLNMLKNKITSAPSETDPNIWLPYNIGRTRSAGMDLHARAGYSTEAFGISAEAAYTFQKATDITSGSDTYGQQIPYVPAHSVNLKASASYKGWELGAGWNIRKGLSDSYGTLPDWNTLHIHFHKAFRLNHSLKIDVSVAAENVTDHRYELSRGYPMPGRSVTGRLGFIF